MTFYADPPPFANTPEGQQIIEWCDRHFRRIQEQQTQLNHLILPEINSAPSKPINGMIVRADGTNWNPGAGAGHYYYDESTASWISIMATDYLIEVRRGNIAGASLVHKFGRNDGVPNGSWEFVNQLGFTAWPLSAATTVRVKAGNTNDTAGGTGAREITVQGIDSNGDEIAEALVTAGTSASSNSTASFTRVHRAWVSAAGSGEKNAANVVIENSAGTQDLIQITTGEGQSQFAGWTVPNGKTAYLLSLHVFVDSGKAANIRLMTRADHTDTTAPVHSHRLKLFFDGVKGNLVYVPRSPGSAITQLSDIWVEAYGDGAASEVSADFELLVLTN